ncbi:MAG: hypothetical protein Q4B12_05025 [Bowdeniella nasicola]|nr:hypothetical protein [Bowdeniella nasicola]
MGYWTLPLSLPPTQVAIPHKATTLCEGSLWTLSVRMVAYAAAVVVVC